MPEKKITKAIVCPMCGEMSKADVYTSINPSVTKGVRRRALDGELFAWKCPSCGYSARLTYPILYNDMKNRFMVYFIPKIDHFQLCDNELEEKYSNLRNISKRIVPTFNSFKEKIFIFESGLDDMSVELTKLAISQTVSKKLNGAEIHDGYLSMYDRERNTMGFTYFTGEKHTPYVQTARLEIYVKSKKIVDSLAYKDKKLKGFLKIDREWAENILYRYKRMKHIEKLNKLKEELSNVNVRVITLDFSRESDSMDLYEHIKNENEQIDFLVNNAGFGAYGKFLDVPLERELELIHTNVSTVHILTKLFLKDMAERNSGYILNVGSAAGFLAGPTFASYYASKNYVVRLTQAIHEEMRRDNKNVKVSVLCPGPVKTNFNNVADVKFCIRGLDPKFVARYAVDMTLKGKMIITPGFEMKAVSFFRHFAPEKLLTRISYNVQMKKNGIK